MIQFVLYISSFGLVAVGAISLISALNAQKTWKICLASASALVPALFGVWLFMAAGLKIGDLPKLIRQANSEFSQIATALSQSASQNSSSFQYP
jgi:hypothetical protein